MATEVEVELPVPLPNVTLVESDGEPLESHWHVLEISLLIESLGYWFRDRNDFYAGGNMFIYFSEEQARNRHFRGPDFFYVDGVNRLPLRRYWAVWQEGGRYPDVIIELVSPTTAVEDRTTKRTVYERTFRTHEYFCYDPLSQQLEGWRLGEGLRYRDIEPNPQGWMWIEELQLWLGPWRGPYQRAEEVWLRFYDPEGRVVPIWGEAAEEQAQAARQQAQAAKEQAQAAKEQAQAAKEQAQAAKEQAQAAEQRAQSAEEELAQLRARLAELEGSGGPPPEQGADR